ncbi:Putative fluoride ion transporter CrcB [Septoria linicola]|uniref:Fluoride ion transporter CrcB n=1 Tax=Septoria linicola TaxID=215465 RepID=A0A9Q9AQX9_9PEZI|nr:Putative fluoride ion transporter CrcB [Septoria linicola]
MAESSWPGLPDSTLPREPAFAADDDFRITEYRPRPGNRDSASTSKSRRESYYDAQRGPDAPGRRSRPTSTASVLTTRSKGKQRASYQEPMDYENLDETAYPHPVPSQDNRRTLEDVRGGEQPQTQADGTGMHVRNFSRISARRKTNETDREGQNISEVSALPPIPKSNRFSAATTARPATQPTKRSGDLGNGPDHAGSPRPFSRRQPEEFAKPVDPVPRWLTEVYTISYLIFFAIFGTLARLGIQWITFYPGAPIVTPVIWANMAGSWLMGFLSEDQSLFRDHALSTSQNEKADCAQSLEKAEMNKHKKVVPLYIGLATGFCGSLTSFSSFARDFFLALSNNLPAPIYHQGALAAGDSPSSTIGRNAGYSFEALFGVIFTTLALSIGGYFVGAHTALALGSVTPSLPVKFIRKTLDPVFFFLALGCWIGAVIMAALPPDRSGGLSAQVPERWRGEVLFAIVFAPLGALLRFYVSLQMNGFVAWFPLGTFVVNMFGTAIEGMCYDIQHVGITAVGGQIGGGLVGCQVLQGVQDGFCGCLTTISTWVAEIVGLKRRHGYLYAASSLIGGLALMVVIMGSVRWSVGFQEPVCSTGYPNKVNG